MGKITASLPEELSRKMKRHSEVRWSEVIRKALADYVANLEMAEGGVVSTEELSRRLKEKCVDVSTVDLDKAIEYCEEGRKLAWKRLSTIQASA